MSKPKALTRAALRGFPLPRVEDGEKDSKGRIVIIAGSSLTPGTALLAASAAMRSGAGRLRILAVDSIAVPVGVAMPEAMVFGLPEARDGGFARSAMGAIREQAEQADVVVAGPGMARAQSCAAIAKALLQADSKLVLDAALLHSLSQSARGAGDLPILLPHAGELASLLDTDEAEIERDPIGCGLRAAELYKSNVLVKGVVSHVVAPDGRVWTHRGGAAGLGVSGSGDTLAGIVGGLASRGADPLTALLWGVLLHGEAGAALARRVGPAGFLAREIPGELPGLMAR